MGIRERRVEDRTQFFEFETVDFFVSLAYPQTDS
jgi:hypothetical protein